MRPAPPRQAAPGRVLAERLTVIRSTRIPQRSTPRSSRRMNVCVTCGYTFRGRRCAVGSSMGGSRVAPRRTTQSSAQDSLTMFGAYRRQSRVNSRMSLVWSAISRG